MRRGEQARKDCDEHLSSHYATYNTAYSISLLHSQLDSRISSECTAFVEISICYVVGLALHLHQYTHECTPLMGVALSQ